MRKLIEIYECLCEPTRLRLIHVLSQGPLCVCHFQAVLQEPQVKISKHLGYLRSRGVVEVERSGNWMIYALPATPSVELAANLACLRECGREQAEFQRDLERLKKLQPTLTGDGPECCRPARRQGVARSRPRRSASAASRTTG